MYFSTFIQQNLGKKTNFLAEEPKISSMSAPGVGLGIKNFNRIILSFPWEAGFSGLGLEFPGKRNLESI